MTKECNKDYEVGRGKPPAHTRFKKGQSGNPSGRPKKEPGVYNVDQLRKLMLKEGNQRIKVVQDGEPAEITVIQGVFKRLHKKALDGDMQAIRFTIEQHLTFREADDASRLKMMEMLHDLQGLYKDMTEKFREDPKFNAERIVEMHDLMDEVRRRILDGLED